MTGRDMRITAQVEEPHKDWGKGQPVVLSHGWPLSADAATLGALDMKLSPDQIARLDEASAIPLGPHEQINGSARAIASGKPERLDLPSIPVA